MMCVFGRSLSWGQPVGLDSTWSDDGRLSADFSGGDDQARAVRVLADGRVLVAGSYLSAVDTGVMVARYLVNGDQDPSFGTNGMLNIDARGSVDVELLSDGAFLLATACSDGGDLDICLMRFTAAGEFDLDFGVNGRVLVPLTTGDDRLTCMSMGGGIITLLVETPDGQRCVRLLVDGTLDGSFSQDGVTDVGEIPITAVAIAHPPDNGVVLVGAVAQLFALARLDPDGELDLDFGIGGSRIDLQDFAYGSSARAVVVNDAGDLLVAGYAWGSQTGSEDMVLLRYDASGERVPTFGVNGFFRRSMNDGHDRASAIGIQSSGSILVTGDYYANGAQGATGCWAIRCTPDGVEDPTFADGQPWSEGAVRFRFTTDEDLTTCTAMDIAPNDAVLVVGYSTVDQNNDMGIVRIHSGTVVTDVHGSIFATWDQVAAPNPFFNSTQVTLNGAVAGSISFELFDARGDKLRSWSVFAAEGRSSQEIDLSGTGPGSYTLVVTRGTHHRTLRLIRL